MKKIFEILACIFAVLCAAYGAYILFTKYLLDKPYEETTEFDDLYNDYIAGRS